MSRVLKNLVNGKWLGVNNYRNIYNVFNGKLEYKVPDTQINELQPFIESLKSVPKSGVHNPLKNNERYLQFGEISRKVRDLYPCVM